MGIQHDKTAKAYDWNELLAKKVINDSLPGLPVVIVIEPDNASFHVWNRNINNQSLVFSRDIAGIIDITTGSTWNFDGLCTDGALKGQRLMAVQASQEFWHSWQTFHPGTQSYK